jgi:hypothetical protein
MKRLLYGSVILTALSGCAPSSKEISACMANGQDFFVDLRTHKCRDFRNPNAEVNAGYLAWRADQVAAQQAAAQHAEEHEIILQRQRAAIFESEQHPDTDQEARQGVVYAPFQCVEYTNSCKRQGASRMTFMGVTDDTLYATRRDCERSWNNGGYIRTDRGYELPGGTIYYKCMSISSWSD